VNNASSIELEMSKASSSMMKKVTIDVK